MSTTLAGQRLAWFFETEPAPRGSVWPRSFDARLTQRLVEEFVVAIEVEAYAKGYAAGLTADDPPPDPTTEAVRAEVRL